MWYMRKVTSFSVFAALAMSSGMLFGDDYYRVSYGNGLWTGATGTNVWNTDPSGSGTGADVPTAFDNAILGDVVYAGNLYVSGQLINNVTVSGDGWGLIGASSLDVRGVLTLNSNSSFEVGSLVTLNVAGLTLNSGALLSFSTSSLHMGSGALYLASFNEGDEKIKLNLYNFGDFSDMTIGETRTIIATTSFFIQDGLTANDIFELQNVPSGYEFQFSAQGLDLVAVPEPSTYAGLLSAFVLGFTVLRRRK